MSKKTSKKPNQLDPKPILRTASELCNSVKKKAVRFCEDLNQILLITPRQILRRSERNRNKTATFNEDEENTPFSLLDLDATCLSDTSSSNDSYSTQKKEKISNKLKKAIEVNNKRKHTSPIQRAYYNKVKIEIERRASLSKTFSMFTIYDYTERISMLETELWSDVFMPTKPFLSDINNDTLVQFNQWLKVNAASIFKNNNISKKVRKTFEISRDADFDKLVNKRRNNINEPRTTIIHGHTGSGKTQLVYCSAKHMGCEVFEISPSDFRSRSKMEITIKKAESNLTDLLNHTGKKLQSSCKIPLILIDDADVYFDNDSGYLEYLIELIENIELPLILTVTDLTFATKLCEKFEESEIQLMTLNYTSKDLISQIQHFVSALFVYDFEEEEIASIVEAAGGSDIRAALNILQFFYAPIIMKPLYEDDLLANLFEIPLPVYEEPKKENKVRYLAELQSDLYRCDILQSKSSTDFFNGKIGYLDSNTGMMYSILSDTYLEMFNDLSSDYSDGPESRIEMGVKWW